MNGDSLAPKRWPVRLGLAAVVLVYLGYSSFGIAHPVLWGHYGHQTGEYLLRARASLRFHLLIPATSPGFEPPLPSTYYFHHPIGYHHLYTLLIFLFGDHALLGAIAPALTGLLTLWALYALGRRWWSRELALLAVALFVALPIVASFSILTDAMLPAMACSLVMARAWLEYRERPSRYWLVVAAAVTLAGGLLMWEAYFQALFHGLAALWRRRRDRLAGTVTRLDGRDAWRTWVAVTWGAAAAAMGFHCTLLVLRAQTGDFVRSFVHRHNANFLFALEQIALWLRINYGSPLVALGLLWLALYVRRRWRHPDRVRARDGAVLIFFQINLLYVVLFANATVVHLYRVFWFSSFLVLAAIDLVDELRALLRRRLDGARATRVLAAAICAWFVLNLPHTVANLVESRDIMGTFAYPGYDAEPAKMRFADEVARRTGRDDFVVIHDSIARRKEFYYHLDRTSGSIATLAELPALTAGRPRAVVLADAAIAEAEGEREHIDALLARHPALLFEHYLFIDLRSHVPGMREVHFEPEPASALYRWFVSRKYPPMRSVERATLVGLCAAQRVGLPEPPGAGESPAPPWTRPELGECWHNREARRGHAEAARATRNRLLTLLRPIDNAAGVRNRFLGYSVPTKSGAAVWVQWTEAPIRGLHWRWRLTLLSDSKHEAGRPLAGEVPSDAAGGGGRAPLRAGDLHFERLRWQVVPGRYRLHLELVAPTAPAAPLAAGDVGAVILN
jgi:dolichyl-phosphate-mannose-protein mannosyltransferase